MSHPTPKTEFLLECFRAANSRLVFRVRQRDRWLKVQFFLQIALFTGVFLSGWYTPGLREQLHYLLVLSMPVSFICAGLYAVEDRLIGHIVAYLSSLTDEVLEDETQRKVYNLESSPQGRDYVRTALPVRLVSQMVVFLLLPLGITAYGSLVSAQYDGVRPAEIGLDLLLAGLIAYVLTRTFQRRRG